MALLNISGLVGKLTGADTLRAEQAETMAKLDQANAILDQVIADKVEADRAAAERSARFEVYKTLKVGDIYEGREVTGFFPSGAPRLSRRIQA